MRWGWIFMRASIMPLVTLVAAAAVAFSLWKAGAVPLLNAFSRFGDYVWAGGCVAAVGLWAHFGYRLWAWQQAATPACGFCGGPVGHRRDGKVFHGRQLSDFRRCYNCGRANAELD